jgi:hypothetical protein
MSATNRGAARKPYDAYQTPPEVVEAMMREIVWGRSPTIMEPCAGQGNIVRVLHEYLPDAEITEMDIQRGQDFLKADIHERYDFIVTNPPFMLAKEFVDKSLRVANCVVMLLRLGFLAGQKRREWWRRNPPTALFVLSKRPSFTGQGTDSTDYAWFVFDNTGRQKRGIYWL